MAGGAVTGIVAGGKNRPKVEAFVALIEALHEEELVRGTAAVSVGPVAAGRVVAGAKAPGAGRTVTWTGADLPGLLAAVRAGYGQDVAVWFETVDLEAFEPAEEEEYEDVPDEGDDDGEDDGPAPSSAAGKGAPAKAAPAPTDLSLGEFEIVAPSLVLYSVGAPLTIEVGGKKPKPLGPTAAWAALDGEDMSLLVDDLGDSWLLDVLEEGLGSAKVGKIAR